MITAGRDRGLNGTDAGQDERSRRLSAVSKAAAELALCSDLNQTLSCIAEHLTRITEVDRGVIWLRDEAGENLRQVAVTSPSAKGEDGGRSNVKLPLADKTVAGLLRLAKPVYYSALSDSYGQKHRELRAFLIGSQDQRVGGVVVVPLTNANVPIGMMAIAVGGERSPMTGSDIGDLTDSDIEDLIDALALFGSFAASAIGRAQSDVAVNLQLLETIGRGKREWEQTFDAISDGIFITNRARTVIRANKAFAAIFDKHPRDVVGKRCHELVWGRETPCPECPYESEESSRDRPSLTACAECVIKGMIAEVRGYPMFDENGNLAAVVHILKDVTVQKKLQELFVRSERLRAIGEMASGVAHDFNNLLSSIIGWSEIMLVESLPPSLRQGVTAVHRAAVDGTETVRRIQEYTRIRKDTEFVSVDLNEVVIGAIELARPRWKAWAERAGITISVATAFGDIPRTRGNSADLREVFLNMILNAIDAMPEGGEIKIATGRDGDALFASVSDSGVGMNEEIRERVFDPFFTTKGSAGNGLGLSVAYGIVSRHGGDVLLESVVGNGSTFTVLLPVTAELEESPEDPTEEPTRPVRVLLIDDDERVLAAIEAMLSSDGHSVKACLEGKRGIAALQDGQFDVVITDLGMPEVSGWEVADKVKTVSPGTPVVFLTGWAAEIAGERLHDMGVDAIIQKPCDKVTLRNAINQVLGQEARRVGEIRNDDDDESGSNGHLTILVIEDNKWFGEVLKQRLELDGHVVSLARSGAEGLGALDERSFDLVLSDLNLSDTSGLEVARGIRRRGRGPIVAIMTGDPDAIDKADASLSDVDGILPKPWKDFELQEVLQKAFARRGVR